ncbi:MAG: TIGR02186 family protein, partial [Betaproteobacteria bacterium]|nr:TIGR02186 family protein [Betaproteobacteria bacterium]
MRRWLCLLVVLPAWMAAIQSRAGEPLVVVPEKDQVDITTDFAGTEFKAVGAIEGAGDLIIKVVGPQQEVTLSRQIKLGPFWMGGDRVRVAGAPSVLLLYATRPIASLLSRADQEKHGLLLEGATVRIE